MKNRFNKYLIGVTIGLTFIISYNYYSKVFHNAFDYDEVDYINAAKFGFVKNALSYDSPNIFEFIEMGKFKLNNDTIAIENLLKRYPSQANDPFFLRHYHPVLPIYFWALITKINKEPIDKYLRIANYIFYLITYSVLIFLSISLLKKHNINLNYANLILVCSALILTFPFLYTFSSLNFHIFLGFFSIIFFYYFELFNSNPTQKYLLLLGTSSALLILSFETSLLLIGFRIIWVIVKNKSLKFLFTKRSIILLISFALIVFIFWPAFFTKLEYGKTIGMYLYRIFGKSNEEYGHISYWDTWSMVFIELRDFFILNIFLLIAVLKEKKDKILFPSFLVGGLFYFVAMTPFLLNKTYIYPGIVLLTFFFIVNISTILKSYTKYGLIVSIFFIILFSLNKNNYSKENRILFNKNLETIKNINKGEIKILLQDAHIFNFYLKSDNLENLDIPEKNDMKFKFRFDFNHKDRSDAVIKGGFDFVILYNSNLYLDLFNQLKDNYELIEKNQHLIFFKNKKYQ